MTWLAWLANKHTLLVHLPVAAALMIPIPIFAAQRGGRGIRPWWVTCRYVAWSGLVGSLLAVLSGFLQTLLHGPVRLGAFRDTAVAGGNPMFQLHAAGGAASLVLGALCLRSLFRHRQDHQGIGFPALLLGVFWCASALTAAYTGARVVGHRLTPPAQAVSYSSPMSTSRGLPAPRSPPMMPSSSMRSMIRAARP